MADDERKKADMAERWRGYAKTLRRAADDVTSSTTRTSLLKLADDWEGMARMRGAGGERRRVIRKLPTARETPPEQPTPGKPRPGKPPAGQGRPEQRPQRK